MPSPIPHEVNKLYIFYVLLPGVWDTGTSDSEGVNGKSKAPERCKMNLLNVNSVSEVCICW